MTKPPINNLGLAGLAGLLYPEQAPSTRNWESVFTTWANGPASTENEKCENAERAIKNAIKSSDALKNRNIEVFIQGSYRNRVNIKKDSDVDVGIVCRDTFIYESANNVAIDTSGIYPATYQYDQFKNDVYAAIINYFGSASITPGSKAFDIHANTYRVEADLAPFFEYRYYWNSNDYSRGVTLFSSSGHSVKNYPEQHYSNGVNKNNNTYRRYKRVIRILKNLKSEMESKGFQSAKSIPGFLIECLVFNIPDEKFSELRYRQLIRSVLAYIFNETMAAADCTQWVEVNNIKYLFHYTQPWTKEQAHAFASDAWDYIGYE